MTEKTRFIELWPVRTTDCSQHLLTLVNTSKAVKSLQLVATLAPGNS